MKRSLITRAGLACVLLASFSLLLPASGTAPESKTSVDFETQIAPLIVEHCIRCHKPGNEKGELSLDSLQSLTEKGFLTPGKPDESYLLEVIHVDPQTGKAEMPKGAKPLSKEEVALFSRWIKQGANWPEKLKLQEKSKADLSWWSLQPLAQTDPPLTKGMPAAWQKQPIDRFIAAKLHEKNLQPSPRASKRTLIRRATYNLTGLPPTPEEVAAFEN
ncbi:MAG: DUF1549 domain-containing protein, partial [Planctomycetaceae bacterium]|nr:DUF1549 domain-containing protein [Planctomycetaceae bacterium]